MATDLLILGALAFDDWSTPSHMPFGGEQAMAVHRLPGGARVVHTLGPDERDIQFTGTIYDNNAYGVAEELDALRLSGAQVPLAFAGRFYVVIVKDVQIDIERFPQLMRYHVTCVVVRNDMAGPLSAIPSTVSDLVKSDMATALSIVGL